MDHNPLFDADGSDGDSSSHPSLDGLSYTGAISTVPTPPVAVLQTVNIKSHVPVVLELANPNYDEWRCFFDAFLGKFNLVSHISSPPTPEQCHDPDWIVVDQCIVSWLYISIAKDVRNIVRAPKAMAYRIWQAIREQFRDNELHRAVYLEAEFRNLV
ncbi:uncharacterized protein [Miscanthus floridulus]|uniref:uncharacterized protein n=1 Tax=Miscanthus floridulus TaxID=154761 RepID=UPI00345AD5E9